MSNKQKFLSVLSTIVQPQAKNPRQAWKLTEEVWERHLLDIKKVPKEELEEMVNYAMLAMVALHNEGEIGLFGAVVLDDLKVVMHGHACERCKAKEKSDCAAEDTQTDAGSNAGPEGIGTIRTFSSFEELVAAFGGGKKPPN